MPLEPTSKHHTSIAGEFAVLSQLALRGYAANLTVGSTKSVDILVSQPDGPMLALLLEEFGEFQQGGEGERAALVRLCRIWLQTQRVGGRGWDEVREHYYTSLTDMVRASWSVRKTRRFYPESRQVASLDAKCILLQYKHLGAPKGPRRRAGPGR